MSVTERQNTKILVIDDDEAIVDALVLLLEFEGFQAVSAVEGELLDRVIELQPDAILLDVWLSGRDGRELCRQLKQNPHTSHIPVILISASRELEMSAKKAGANAYVEKPFELDKLIETVRTLLR